MCEKCEQLVEMVNSEMGEEFQGQAARVAAAMLEVASMGGDPHGFRLGLEVGFVVGKDDAELARRLLTGFSYARQQQEGGTETNSLRDTLAASILMGSNPTFGTFQSD